MTTIGSSKEPDFIESGDVPATSDPEFIDWSEENDPDAVERAHRERIARERAPKAA